MALGSPVELSLNGCGDEIHKSVWLVMETSLWTPPLGIPHFCPRGALNATIPSNSIFTPNVKSPSISNDVRPIKRNQNRYGTFKSRPFVEKLLSWKWRNSAIGRIALTLKSIQGHLEYKSDRIISRSLQTLSGRYRFHAD
jgi:hypothetical protein